MSRCSRNTNTCACVLKCKRYGINFDVKGMSWKLQYLSCQKTQKESNKRNYNVDITTTYLEIPKCFMSYLSNEIEVDSTTLAMGNLLTYLLTYLLTPWCRVLLENLTGLQLVYKFPAFHGTRRFVTALISARHPSLSCASPIQSIYPHPTSWRSILILSTHLRLGLPSGLFLAFKYVPCGNEPLDS